MANILILVHGTGGDIRQMSRIGGALRRCGHEVTVITHCGYERQVHAEGLNYAPIDTPEEYEQVLIETGRNTSFNEQLAYIQRRILPKLAIEYQLLRERQRPGETVLVTHANTYLAARILAETLGLPIATAFTAPAFLAQVPLVEAVLGKALGPAVNKIRADFGLPPVGDWSAWWRKDSHPIALWPEWYAPPDPDWPADLVQAGFLMTDPPVPGALPAEAEAFLESGDPPVLVTGGTGIFVEANYYQTCLEACRRLGRRVVLVARYQTHVPRSLPESVALFSVLPFASLMPRVAAVIHHGGLATLSQALASGVPQLVLARGLDRPDNAQRVEHLGVGKYLPPPRWQADAIAEALASLMNEGVSERCQELARRIREHDSLTPIANLIETILRSGQTLTPSQLSDSNGKTPALDDPALALSVPAATPKLAQLSQQRLELAARLLRQKNGNGNPLKAPSLPREDLAAVRAITDLSAEAVLDDCIHPDPCPASRDLRSPAMGSEPANIFFTGATGFLGAFLLHELWQQTPATLYCLVRAAGQDEGRQRLQQTLTAYGLWDESVSARLVPVPGNLSEPLLGIAEEEFSRLAGTLDVIYHNGAQVNFVYPYTTLKAPNVLGTQEVLRLACRTKVKPVHYVSTLSVTASLDQRGEGQTGYTQSKWVAEQLVMLAGSRGLPVSIYRPGRITGHSHTGVCNTEDLLCKMIKGCIRLGSVPDLESMQVDITPVDYVSRAIVYLSRQAEASGQTFPLFNPDPVPWQVLVTWVTSLGYPLRQVSYEAWRTELLEVAGHSDEEVFASLVPLFSERTTLEPIASQAPAPTPTPALEFQAQPSALDLLKGTSIFCPPANADLMKTYFSYFRRCGFLEAN